MIGITPTETILKVHSIRKGDSYHLKVNRKRQSFQKGVSSSNISKIEKNVKWWVDIKLP